MQLTDSLEKHFRLAETQKKALNRLKLETIEDLLYYFPARYSHVSEVKLISTLESGELVTLYGKIENLKTKKAFKSKMPMGEATLKDSSGSIKIMWFNQAYMAKMVEEGSMVQLSGKVTEGSRGMYISNPELTSTDSLPIDAHDSLFGSSTEVFGFPVYRETRGITSRFIYHKIQKIISSGLVQEIQDYIPENILEKYKLPKLSTALIWIHAPQNKNHADAARKRFAFEEVFLIQLARKKEREAYEENKSYPVKITKEKLQEFMDRFPFEATKGQKDAIAISLKDMGGKHPMARLLEGDVGSGKTAVAATLSYAAIMNRPDNQTFGNLQVAYMAPTEILASQHFENFIEYFKHTGISVGLITGSGCKKFPSKVASAKDNWTTISRNQLAKWVANGEIPIVIGTHALIQKNVVFKDLALAIIDEQHRFGTQQRKKLVTKEGFAPHLLSMTATPIPRTLALTIYGDLDLTLLDQMPKGRKQVITDIVSPHNREEVYEHIEKSLEEGRQAYVICPRIDEPDPTKAKAVQAKSVTQEAKRLKKEVFKDWNIGILHSKMNKQKKEEVMDQFAHHEIDILVATSVVEVGVNVPNATMIIIEGAERFGLAQLHQLRGRVIRSSHQAYCWLFADSKSEKTTERLKAIKTAKNGFELSELDLKLRGAGELAGAKQWGITDLGMEAIKNIKMVEAAREEAGVLVKKLEKLPTLLERVEKKQVETHFE